MRTDIQMKEHVKEALHDGTLYLGYEVDVDNSCSGCCFYQPRSCKRPLATSPNISLFFCGARFNGGKNIIWMAEVTA